MSRQSARLQNEEEGGLTEYLLIDPSLVNPDDPESELLPVIAVKLSPKDIQRILKRRSANGFSRHGAKLLKPDVIGQGNLATVINISEKISQPTDFGDISRFANIKIPKATCDYLKESNAAPLRSISGVTKMSLKPNQCCVLRYQKQIVLGIYKPSQEIFVRVPDPHVIQGKLSPFNAELAFAAFLLNDDSIPVVAITGPAGTGKSTMAYLAAFSQILNGKYKSLEIFRSNYQIKGQPPIAAVPGKLSAKLAASFGPVMTTLERVRLNFEHELFNLSRGKSRKPSDKLEFGIPVNLNSLNYIRGEEYAREFIVADESQNKTPSNMLTLGTRVGMGSKIVIVGDAFQTDHPDLDHHENGLTDMIKRFESEDLFAQIQLTTCLRGPVATMFIRRYCS